MNLEFAAVAGAGIDFPDREAAAKAAARGAIDLCRKRGEHCIVDTRRRFGDRAAGETLEQRSAHGGVLYSWSMIFSENR
jgi:hypothetical protein